MRRRWVTGIASIGASLAGSNRETRLCTYIATYGAVSVERPKAATSWSTPRSASIYRSQARAKHQRHLVAFSEGLRFICTRQIFSSSIDRILWFQSSPRPTEVVVSLRIVRTRRTLREGLFTNPVAQVREAAPAEW